MHVDHGLTGTNRERPGLREAIEYMRDGDKLTVQEVDRLGRNLLEGLNVLTNLFERGIAVKVIEALRPASKPSGR